MSLEIERKFLVAPDFDPTAYKGLEITQGYFQHDESKVTRIRIYGPKAFLTLKAKVEQQFKVRQEFEYEIPVSDARELLALCSEEPIYKTRYLIPNNEHIWELDVFHKSNQGLVIAEIELKNETEEVNLPYWIMKEVTEDKRYINSYLAKQPFTEW